MNKCPKCGWCSDPFADVDFSLDDGKTARFKAEYRWKRYKFKGGYFGGDERDWWKGANTYDGIHKIW